MRKVARRSRHGHGSFVSVTRVAAVVGAVLAMTGAARGQGQQRGAGAPGLSMSAGMKFSQIYKPDAWQPVRFDFRNDADRAIDAVAVLPLSDPAAPAAMTLPVSVPARSRLSATVWGYFPPRAAAAGPGRQVPPLAVAECRGLDGALLARSEILGIPIAQTGDGSDVEYAGEMLLLVDQRGGALADAYDVTALAAYVKEAAAVPIAVAGITLESLPREAAGLLPVKAVILEGVDPNSLDAGQRQALLDYLRGGGTVVLAAPVASVCDPGSWLAPLMPVRPIGSRLARGVDVSPALKFRTAVPIVEAVVSPVGQVLLGDRDYVHVAATPVGLGRIVFTSFPINAVAHDQPEAAALWEKLLGLRQPGREWNATQLGEIHPQVLGAMVGRTVAPWGVAAGVVGGYLLVILAGQTAFSGAARPRALAVSLSSAAVLSGALLVMGMAWRGDQVLQSARLAVIDVTADGGGWRREAVAFTGADAAELSVAAIGERVVIRPAVADESNRPTVRQQPFAVEQAGVFAEHVERVWEAEGPADAAMRIDAVARFGPTGLALAVDNGLGTTIESPVVLWDRRALSLPDIPAGKSTPPAPQPNANGDFTNATVLTSDLAKRRGQVVRASVTPPGARAEAVRAPLAPVLVGWLTNPADRGLLRPVDREVADPKAMVMVRAPVRIEPPAPGTTITVPAALTNFRGDRFVYDTLKAETVPSPLPGEWLIGFAVPREVGRVRPSRVTLEARLTFPAHTLTVRRGQCLDGKPRMNPTAEPAVHWSKEVGLKQFTFDCAPDDYDADGRVWLMLEVRGDGPAIGAASWQIKDLAMSFDAAEAVEPPKAFSLDLPDRETDNRENR